MTTPKFEPCLPCTRSDTCRVGRAGEHEPECPKRGAKRGARGKACSVSVRAIERGRALLGIADASPTEVVDELCVKVERLQSAVP